MKNLTKNLVTVAMVLGLGTIAMSAQSCAAVNHASNAVGHSMAASGEVAAAGAESGAALVKTAAGVVAVPVMLSGAAVATGGSVVAAVGESSVAAGEETLFGGAKLWDFASGGDAASRPPMQRERAVPTKKAAALPKDLSPAEAVKAKR